MLGKITKLYNERTKKWIKAANKFKKNNPIMRAESDGFSSSRSL
jgi:hypothetical protein